MSSSGRLASPPPVGSRKQLTTDQGVPIDLDHAYAKLSDDALARSGGVLGMLPERRPVTSFEGEHIRAGTGESLTREGGVRLQKDYDVDIDEHAVVDSSEDETSSGESIESNSPVSEEEEHRRGRAAARRNTPRGSSQSSIASNSSTKGGLIQSMIKIVGDPGGGGSKKKKKSGVGIDARKGTFSMRRTSMSMLAAAEEERMILHLLFSPSFFAFLVMSDLSPPIIRQGCFFEIQGSVAIGSLDIHHPLRRRPRVHLPDHKSTDGGPSLYQF